MNIESICTRHIVSLEGHESLQRAALLMREQHVGVVVVTAPHDEGVQVLGVVTDRDLAIEVLARGAVAAAQPVSSLVQGAPVGVDGSAGLEHAVQMMEAAGVRRLLVHDERGQLIGLLSLDDLLPALTAPLASLAVALKRGAAREAARRGPIAAAAAAAAAANPTRPALRVPAMGTAGWRGPMAGSIGHVG